MANSPEFLQLTWMDDGHEEGSAVGGEVYGRQGEGHVSTDSTSQRWDTGSAGIQTKGQAWAWHRKTTEQGNVEVLRSGDPLMLFEQRVHRKFW